MADRMGQMLHMELLLAPEGGGRVAGAAVLSVM